ncbi:DUF4396 domain-containing protein [Pleomorphomonas sp. NRK KF1]|uniref:DUF4396 domain-containing protein n=1 Tax=Pleomorphomonas sp. NRK KF1 TaxID=2943000 RepID=UPI002042BF0B|nr:DUF4396 domain-containing protein [Pleomorphomonas sp. NRK KF1]MCM5551838.1 DUF4396 domain-containing protein [Pleomorphomonas sp. NRK KF1]
MVPAWLHTTALLSLAAGFVIAFWIGVDEWRRPQRMWIMNLVWPITALFGTFITLVGYLLYGRQPAKSDTKESDDRPKEEIPFPVMVAKGATHCGSGCTIGDLLAEWLAFSVPAVAVWLGWNTLFEEKMFAVWILDFLFAFAIGVAFQYFTIKPMRQLSVRQGLIQAVKADALSLSAWQIGMYAFMAFAQFQIFRGLLGVPLEVATPEFWFMMQIAMLFGFITSYPVNWWLMSKAIKERM